MVFDEFTNVEVSAIDVFSTVVVLRVVRQIDRGRVVNEQWRWIFLREAKLFCEFAVKFCFFCGFRGCDYFCVAG